MSEISGKIGAALLEPYRDSPRRDEHEGGKIMKKTALFLLTVLLWAMPASAKEVVRSFRQQIPVGTAGRIHLDFPVGELHVEGWEGRQVDLDVRITCNRSSDRCADAAKRLRLVYNAAGGQLEVKIK